MTRKTDQSVFVILSVILVVALTINFITAAGNAVVSVDSAVSRNMQDDTIIRDMAKLNEIIRLRGNTKYTPSITRRKIESEQITDAVTDFMFKLPASLQSIEDEAFEGTAMIAVDIPETVERIGERAFSNIATLRKVRIPEKTTFIAKTAFDGSNRVTITGAPGSYARKYARENGIPFAPLTVMYANADAGGGIGLSGSRTSSETTDAEGQDKQNENRPTGRTAGEIKVQTNLDGVAYHITGRAPPADA